MSKPKPRKRPDPKAALYRAGHVIPLARYKFLRAYVAAGREARYAK